MWLILKIFSGPSLMLWDPTVSPEPDIGIHCFYKQNQIINCKSKKGNISSSPLCLKASIDVTSWFTETKRFTLFVLSQTLHAAALDMCPEMLAFLKQILQMRLKTRGEALMKADYFPPLLVNELCSVWLSDWICHLAAQKPEDRRTAAVRPPHLPGCLRTRGAWEIKGHWVLVHHKYSNGSDST